jgi:uncharacterized SAM-binding protein YcdF (DUF218 family)
MNSFDAVIVPGGGVLPDGTLSPWVKARLDLALELAGDAWIIVLSAGTTHKPGAPVFESVAGAKYLVERGCHPRRILIEWSSYDTIGNAYFARMHHTEPAAMQRLLVVTSEFHLERTRAVFEWVYGLTPRPVDYRLEYRAAPNTAIDEATLAERRLKERGGLLNVLPLAEKIRDLTTFHRWLFTEHAAYAAALLDSPRPALSPRLRDSY